MIGSRNVITKKKRKKSLSLHEQGYDWCVRVKRPFHGGFHPGLSSTRFVHVCVQVFTWRARDETHPGTTFNSVQMTELVETCPGMKMRTADVPETSAIPQTINKKSTILSLYIRLLIVTSKLCWAAILNTSSKKIEAEVSTPQMYKP